MTISKENRVAGFNEDTGKCWGLICIIPFGWIFFLASIIRRKNDVIKYKILDAGLALKILHNYIVSFSILTFFVMLLCFIRWYGGIFAIPNIIALVTVVITYNIVVDKILKFEEKKQSDKQDNTPIKPKAKKNSDNKKGNDIKNQLEELKEQNRRQTDTIRKLEKEIKKRGK